MIVVYTAIFGDSDSLKPAPSGADRCVCFTDNPALGGSGWDVRPRATEPHPRAAARLLKVTPETLFPDADRSVWVDGSITIRDLPALLADAGDAEIACLAHPDRDTCYAEGRTVIRLQIAHPDKVLEALASYEREGFQPSRLSTTGLFVRRHTPAVAAFNARWRDQLDQYGTNDQVHVDFCAWKEGIPIRFLRGHYRDNPYAVYDRQDHHHRRQPQFKLEAECVHYLA